MDVEEGNDGEYFGNEDVAVVNGLWIGNSTDLLEIGSGRGVFGGWLSHTRIIHHWVVLNVGMVAVVIPLIRCWVCGQIGSPVGLNWTHDRLSLHTTRTSPISS